jgi:hypothetical protein
VLMLLLIGAGRSRSGGPTTGRAAAAREAHRSYGKGCWGGRKPNCKGRGAPADHGGAKAALDWGVGAGRRWPRGTAEVWWEVAVGAKEQKEKVCVQRAIE